jgi:hypothetical protein
MLDLLRSTGVQMRRPGPRVVSGGQYWTGVNCNPNRNRAVSAGLACQANFLARSLEFQKLVALCCQLCTYIRCPPVVIKKCR